MVSLEKVEKKWVNDDWCEATGRLEMVSSDALVTLGDFSPKQIKNVLDDSNSKHDYLRQSYNQYGYCFFEAVDDPLYKELLENEDLWLDCIRRYEGRRYADVAKALLMYGYEHGHDPEKELA